MRFMMIVKATKDSEDGLMPSQELIGAMAKYNEELARAGVLVAAEGLHPSSGAIRISYPEPGGKPKVVDGPFTESKELIAGFTLIEVKSKEEAIEWAMRMPDPHGFGQGEIELRQVFEAPELTQDPEALAKLQPIYSTTRSMERPN
ncbi:YciI family protein [Cohnella yongneupensis]|uniref:YciI family protein n=1 Tax=Cohnella yongneupensis TaxID=425006 RepID=A0ABW0QXA0_9BACL